MKPIKPETFFEIATDAGGSAICGLELGLVRSFVRSYEHDFRCPARFMQPGNYVIIQSDQSSYLMRWGKQGDSELVCALPFDSQRHSRMPQMDAAG